MVHNGIRHCHKLKTVSAAVQISLSIGGQDNRKRGALVRLAIYANRTTVTFYDSLYNRQTDSRAAFLRIEKEGEHLIGSIWGDSFASVLYIYLDIAARNRCPQSQSASIFHSLGRVYD